jgi:hypothetical protein
MIRYGTQTNTTRVTSDVTRTVHDHHREAFSLFNQSRRGDSNPEPSAYKTPNLC